ncbi:MAG: hypothetical protein VX409_00845 [Verrucomicrobiota bacterium]|nr:hypothetical protein [Verrucomicrobiota bacterium]
MLRSSSRQRDRSRDSEDRISWSADVIGLSQSFVSLLIAAPAKLRFWIGANPSRCRSSLGRCVRLACQSARRCFYRCVCRWPNARLELHVPRPACSGRTTREVP